MLFLYKLKHLTRWHVRISTNVYTSTHLGVLTCILRTPQFCVYSTHYCMYCTVQHLPRCAIQQGNTRSSLVIARMEIAKIETLERGLSETEKERTRLTRPC